MKKAHNSIDMTGKIYNSWKIISEAYLRGKIRYWNAVCLECGTTHAVHGPNVRNGLSKRCEDCGQKHSHDKQKGQVRTKRSAKESAEHYMYIKLKKDAKKRKINWELTKEQVMQLIYAPCHYTGLEPHLVCHPLKHYGLSQKLTEEAVLTRGGIDRIDSSKGYEMGNVVPCCRWANTAKMDCEMNYFIEMCKLVASRFS